ncbi:MAG: ORF6N domain-containing protein [Candidatus Omnitrophica bacterium]|nr:ORF6N domain-containing protein [Candidatus Omnitrophota bacterium]
MAKQRSIVKISKIEQRILLMRGEKVMIDADLAEFYGVSTKRLNEQIKRNIKRFPEDFIFQLTENEKAEVVANCDHLLNLKYSKSLPYAFTEHGAIMAASVLNSARAIEASIFIVRAFVQLREAIASNKEIALKVAQLERKLADHDGQILALVEAIKEFLVFKPVPKKRQIGFNPDE